MQATDQWATASDCPARHALLRHRVRLVRPGDRVVIGLLPQHLAGCRPRMTPCRPARQTKRRW